MLNLKNKYQNFQILKIYNLKDLICNMQLNYISIIAQKKLLNLAKLITD